MGVNVPACVETGLWTFPTLNAPGRALKQGPGRFGHVNVLGGWRTMARTPGRFDHMNVWGPREAPHEYVVLEGSAT